MMIKTSEGKMICGHVKVAENILSRMLGLMFTKDLAIGQGLLIRPCNSVHTYFMNYNLDLIFLDKNNCIVKVIFNMRPWRISWIYFKAHQVLEMKAGQISRDLEIGEKLEVLCIN